MTAFMSLMVAVIINSAWGYGIDEVNFYRVQIPLILMTWFMIWGLVEWRKN
jgi:hypothetical protein